MKTITLISGDGIGPEVVGATRKIIDATGVKITWEECEAGAKVFKKGIGTGVPTETIDSIIRNRIVLKGPLETPVGFGEKSANVTLRKMFEMYGNIRPIKEIPGVKTPYSGRGIDLVIVRENVEDLYAGIEYMQTPGTAECLKLISRNGCEKISRLAFEFARSEGRKSVYCAHKANIMKMTEGLLKHTFEEVAKDYPDIESGNIIVDNCAHQLVKKPEQYDVLVMTNMNGDILSDLGSALIGGLGFAAGANIGDNIAMFEAVHGSAPKYAGKNNINPTAVLMTGIMMLRYIEEFDAANAIEQALFVTLAQDKILTRDIVGDVGAASTTAFTDAIIRNLGKTYETQAKRNYKSLQLPKVSNDAVVAKQRQVDGVDIYFENNGDAKSVGKQLESLCEGTRFSLKTMSCRGVKVYPTPEVEIASTDLYCCRFISSDINNGDIIDLLQRLSVHFHWVHIEKLSVFDGVAAYSKIHGE
jgi:isocitrate dehydrogenase